MTAIADRPVPAGARPDPHGEVPSDAPVGAAQATERARDRLLTLQDPAGWWKGELATNVTMDAEDLLLREFLGIRTPEETAAAARWIRSQQREDGTWANFHGGPADLSTTVEAYLALRLAGDLVEEPHMALTAHWIRGAGGVERTRVFTRIWMALFGLWSWEQLPVMPPELIFLPSAVPLNVYDWACWARQTVVPMTIVSHYRPCRPLPFGLDELRVGSAAPAKPAASWRSVAGLFGHVDSVLHRYERLSYKPLRQAALRQAAAWIVARQEADGGWGGIQPPWVYSLIALHLTGYQLDHPVMRAGLAGLEGFLVHEDTPKGPIRRLEACQSPVWDTALAVIALADAGLPADDPALVRAVDWLVAEEITVPGDWQVRRPGLAPSGWAFEFANDLYPDTDDTAEVILALRRSPLRDGDLDGAADGDSNGVPNTASNGSLIATSNGIDSEAYDAGRRDAGLAVPGDGAVNGAVHGTALETGNLAVNGNVHVTVDGLGDSLGDGSGNGSADAADTADAAARAALNGALRRGADWMIGMQCRDGGWGAFDADNTRSLIEKLPFCDFGAVIDPPSADVTAHIVEALALEGHARHPATLRGVRWLLEHQEAGGSWFGRWGANHVYGTGAVVPALLAAGVSAGHPAVRRAMDWLLATQNADGGWGEDLRSYRDPAWIGRGQSTASQTAWALLALLAQEEHVAARNPVGRTGDPNGPVTESIERAVAYLVDTQRQDGTWDEDLFTGTGFPGDFYINYHLYRLVFPLTALGRYVKQRRLLGQPGVSHQLEVSVRWSSS